MATITEDYVSFETAKLLKEKGFEEECMYFYDWDDKDEIYHICSNGGSCNREDYPSEYSMPTLQMAMKWLREVHNKHCDVGYDIDLNWFFQIIDLKETVEYDYPGTKYYHAENETEFNTYEEAVEAALKYCLENLI